MSSRTRWLLSSALVLLLGTHARADTISLFNSGVDASGNPLAGGSNDPHWSIIAGPGIGSPIPAVVTNNQLVGNYAQSADSRWIWTNASGSSGINSPYTFRLTFDLTGFDPSTATISGSWGVDNDGLILLNGASPVGAGTFSLGGSNTGNFQSFHTFQITGGFVAGVNTLDFLATDTGNPGGLNVNSLVGTVSAVPEPTTLVMVALGAAMVVGVSRRSMRNGGQEPTNA